MLRYNWARIILCPDKEFEVPSIMIFLTNFGVLIMLSVNWLRLNGFVYYCSSFYTIGIEFVLFGCLQSYYNIGIGEG